MPRHVPMRTCIGCRAVRPKRELLRVVRTVDGQVVYDPTGKRSGRGAYFCPEAECLRRGLNAGTLSAALKAEVPAEAVERLRGELEPRVRTA